MIYFKEENYQTIYNISCATFFLLFVNLILSDYVETGVILDMDSFIFCFGNSEKTIYPLIISFIINLLIVPIVKISITNKWGPTFYIPLFTILVCVINGIACYICINNTLALGSAMILLCENVLILYIYNSGKNDIENVQLSQKQTPLLHGKLIQIFYPIKWDKKRYNCERPLNPLV